MARTAGLAKRKHKNMNYNARMGINKVIKGTNNQTTHLRDFEKMLDDEAIPSGLRRKLHAFVKKMSDAQLLVYEGVTEAYKEIVDEGVLIDESNDD